VTKIALQVAAKPTWHLHRYSFEANDAGLYYNDNHHKISLKYFTFFYTCVATDK